jgi:2-oxoglutarate ferredoxin oxidoreductase subunit alpha
MTEGLSLAGMAELPIVIILGQRPGPSTGLPTYSSQTELDFALSAGHGEFLRFVVAPGDVEGSFYWSAMALNIAWKYQIPSLILVDKNLGEGVFNCDTEIVDKIKEEEFSLWEERGDFKRYAVTENNISPLAFPAKANAIVKVNSYEHDEFGITTEDPLETVKMQDKRLSKEKGLINELQDYETVKTHGNKDSDTVIICWGSNKGVCNEVAENLNLRAIQPIVLKPFPLTKFKNALKGAKKIITVESNATGQLSRLIQGYGMKVDGQILKYDGRPFSLEELTERLKSLNK